MGGLLKYLGVILWRVNTPPAPLLEVSGIFKCLHFVLHICCEITVLVKSKAFTITLGSVRKSTTDSFYR